MPSRRQFLGQGLSGLALGLSARGMRWGSLLDPRCPQTGSVPVLDSGPFDPVALHPQSVCVGGLPFASWFQGDDFANTAVPFHHTENAFPGGEPPAPTEEVPLVIVGGGLSGLSAAYLLREHRPVVLELHRRFGGNAQGEEWDGTRYSRGGAYFMTPDEGSFLEGLYHELGLDHNHRLSQGAHSIELGGQLRPDFWTGAGLPPAEVQAFQRYAEIVSFMANENYPDIPLPDSGYQWILDLDNKTFLQDLQDQMGMPIPASLAAAVQSYCYSSFNAGAEELSAASGWNFLAAEEFGRWVCPGGNAYFIQRLWDKLVEHLERPRPGCAGQYLRAGCYAVDVRLRPGHRVQVTYRDSEGGLRSMLAKKAVLCCPKHICKYMIQDLATLDNDKLSTMWQLETRPYLVANVLVSAPTRHDLYDTFLLGSDPYPTNIIEAEAWWHIADVVDGRYEPRGRHRSSVLTIYWPIPSGHLWRRLIEPDAWDAHTQRVAPQIRAVLGLYGLSDSDVRQVRLARWGHAMPIPRPGIIADGSTERLRRPIDDRIYFVHQDNWALPAVETCLLEANHYAPMIARGL